MARFDEGTRVIYKKDGKERRGTVTGKLSGKRRIVTDSGKRDVVLLNKLKYSPDRVLLLETRLGRSLKSKRTYGPMMQRWLDAYGVDVLYERVHTVVAMRGFLRSEGKNIATRFIHVMGHGTDEKGRGTATFHLTFDKLDLVKQADVFKGLRGKIIIFSCCEIGKDRKVLETIKKASGAKAIIAYRNDVSDTDTNLCEVLLYDRLIETRMSPKKVVESVMRALDGLGIRGKKKPKLVCV